MSAVSILLLGASGQVGGPLLTVLRKEYPTVPITVFLRTHTLDSAIKTLDDVTVVHGDFNTPEGLALLEELTSKHSIVINAATSRDIDVNKAVLRGLEKYRATSKKNAILVHLSGAGNFCDNRTTGEFHATGEVSGLQLPFDDTDAAAVRKINADHHPNGPSDEIIMAFANEGKANAYFVCPVGIIGASQDHVGLLSRTEEGRKYAAAPGVWQGWMLQNVKELGFSPQVGRGDNSFLTVHTDDVVSLIVLILAKAIQERDNTGGSVGNGISGTYGLEGVYSNFYIAAHETHRSADIARLFAKVVSKLEAGSSEVKVRSVAYEEAGLVARYLASNQLLIAKNAQRLGWIPRGVGFKSVLLV